MSRVIKIIFLLVVSLLLLATSADAQMRNTLTPADKLYGLSKFWQEVNYNFVYLDKVDEAKWDEAYRQLLASVPQTPNDYAYYRELQKFCALLKDGHTNVYFPQGIEQMTTNFGDYRLFVQNIDNKAIIIRTNASKQDEIPVGSEITEVNGQPTAAYITEHVAPYISSSTDYILKDWGIRDLLKGVAGDTYKVKIKKPKGGIVSLNLTHQLTEEKAVYPEFEPERGLLDFKWLPNGVAYVALNSFGNPKIDSLFIQKLPELYTAKGLIVDLRYNGGGNTEIGTAILKYLTTDKLLYNAKSRTRQHVATYKAWGGYVEPKDTVAGNKDWGITKQEALKYYQVAHGNFYQNLDSAPDTVKLSAKRIIVPTVVLIGHYTASAAEDFLIAAAPQKHLLTMGENSFGSTGQPLSFGLPGGGSARICTKQDTYPDGREFVGYGIKPAVEVKPTLKDYLAKRDPVLIKALAYLKTKIR
ncbi:S41 family peptidase [uncultured Hymenobacter sp.]|uniref:S41 family peptidase n=1 Tax=uncultured Hymenobacter sp. TaxID=170016 RepID=UPI0035CBA76E